MNRTTKTLTYIIGIIMTIAMVGSLILPMLSSQVGLGESAEAAAPTPLPAPTVPAPPDIGALAFDKLHLHRSGLFTFAAPTGWTPISDSNTPDELRAGLGNSELLSVIEVRVNKNHSGINDADGLSNFLDRSWLAHTWSGYGSWDETGRSLSSDGKIRIDFNLRRGRAYLIARQESWIDAGDIVSVRVVMAENAPAELKFILERVGDSIQRLPAYADARYEWDAYFDNSDKHMARYPADWTVTDAADGLPATIIGPGATLAVATVDVALASEEDAQDWIESWRSGVSADSIDFVDVDGSMGFKVSYRLETVDGATDSGLAIMLNGSDNRLHVANLRLSDLDEDLLRADPAAYPLLAVVDSFRLLPELELQA